MGFNGKVALVTGAGAGIGLATAIKFAKLGVKVVGNSIVPAEEKIFLEAIHQAGGEGMFLVGDVSKASDCEMLVGKTVEKYGRLDILCNIAGIVIGGTCVSMSESDFVRSLQVNVVGIFLMSKYAITEMLKTGGGSIVNIGSVAALCGVKDRSGYSASKGAVVSLTKSTAIDYIRDNIRVNCVCPGTTYTPSLEQRFQASPDPEQMRIDFNARQPIGRLGMPEEIAEAVVFCANDEAAFMTGAVIPVDGGWTA